MTKVGKEFQSCFDTMLKNLGDLRDGPVELLQKRGYTVDNAPQLERDIEELKELKKRILDNWPWSGQELPPVDRKMVAESRAAIRRQEGEGIT